MPALFSKGNENYEFELSKFSPTAPAKNLFTRPHRKNPPKDFAAKPSSVTGITFRCDLQHKIDAVGYVNRPSYASSNQNIFLTKKNAAKNFRACVRRQNAFPCAAPRYESRLNARSI